MPFKSERLTEPELKKGDRVRVVDHHFLTKGITGTVVGPGAYGATVMVDFDNNEFDQGGWFRSAFELIEDEQRPQVRKGDQIRVSFEGTVSTVGAGRLRVEFEDDPHGTYLWTSLDSPTIEKLEPPVEVFKPGDTVRYKDRRLDQVPYTLGEGGYFCHLKNVWHRSNYPFTSEEFERVRLEEAPF